MKKFEFSIHFSFSLMLAKNMMGIMLLLGKHHELIINIVYPWNWKYLPYMEQTTKKNEDSNKIIGYSYSKKKGE